MKNKFKKISAAIIILSQLMGFIIPVNAQSVNSPLVSYINDFSSLSVTRSDKNTENGVGEKPDSDVSLKLQFNSTSTTELNCYADIPKNGLDPTADFTLSYEVYTTSGGISIRPRNANPGHQWSLIVIPESDIEANRWNKITLVHHSEASKNDIYINGVFYKTVTADFDKIIITRLYIDSTAVAYLDEIQLIQGAILPAAVPKDCEIEGNYINCFGGYAKMLTSQYENALVRRSDTTVAADDEKPGYGDSLYVYSGDFITAHYYFSNIPTERNANAIFYWNDFESGTLSDFKLQTTLKENTLTLKTSTQRNSKYIELNKQNSGDCHIDTTVFQTHITEFVCEADLMMSDFGANVYPFMIYDRSVGNQSDYPVIIDASGGMKLSDGTKIYTLTKNKWFNLRVECSFTDRTFKIYVDDTLLATQKFKNNNADFCRPTLIRKWIYSGNDSTVLCIDNLKEYEGKCENENIINEEPATIFMEKSELLSYISDYKIYNAFSGRIYDGVQFIQSDKAQESENDFTVSIDVIKKLFSADVQNAVAIKAYAQSLGKYIYETNLGSIIFSDSPISIRADIADEVDSCMLFENPTAEVVEYDFKKNFSDLTTHPRLMANKSTFDSIRTQLKTDTTLSGYHSTVIAQADAYLDTDVVTYEIIDGRLLEVSREVMNKMTYWGYAYQITGDLKYPERAWEELEAVIAFEDWHTEHYIDTAEMMFGAALAYDWMYDAFDEDSQLEKIRTAIIEKGLKPTNDAYHARLYNTGIMGLSSSFATVRTNFNTVSNSSAIMAALAVMEEDIEFCSDVIANGLKSLQYGISQYYPDGGWIEGTGYWLYSTSYVTRLFASLDTTLSTHYGLSDLPGIKETPYYAIGIDSFCGTNNFHDAWPGHINAAEYSYFARLNNDPSLLNERLLMLENKWKGISANVYDMLWYKKTTGNSVALPLDIFTRTVDTFTIRGSYNTPDGIFVSGHGGATDSYHSHLDAGAFVFDIMGERWAHDLTPEDYTVAGKVKKGEQAVYRTSTEGHNCVVINPQSCGSAGQNWTSTAPVKMYSGKRCAYAVQDLTEPYTTNTGAVDGNIPYYGSASSYLRGFYVGDDRRSLTVRDEIVLTKDAEILWHMNIEADDIYINDNVIILTQNGKRLKWEMLTSADNFNISIKPGGKITPDHYAVASHYCDGQTALKEKQRQIVVSINAPKGEFVMEVKMAPANEDAAKTGLMNIPISEWTIPDGEYISDNNANFTGYNYASGKIEPYSLEAVSPLHTLTKAYGIKGKSAQDECMKYSSPKALTGNGIFRWAQRRWNINYDIRSSRYLHVSAEMAPDGISANRTVNLQFKNSSMWADTQNLFAITSDGHGKQVLKTASGERELKIPYGEWFRFDIVADKEKMTYDIYINGEEFVMGEALTLNRSIELLSLHQIIFGFGQVWSTPKGSYYTSDTYYDNIGFNAYNVYPYISSYTSPSIAKYTNVKAKILPNETKVYTDKPELDLFDASAFFMTSQLEITSDAKCTVNADMGSTKIKLFDILNSKMHIGETAYTLPSDSFKLTVFINASDNTYDVYVNDSLTAKAVPIEVLDTHMLVRLEKLDFAVTATKAAVFHKYNTSYGVCTDTALIMKKVNSDKYTITYVCENTVTTAQNADTVYAKIPDDVHGTPILAVYDKNGVLIGTALGNAHTSELMLELSDNTAIGYAKVMFFDDMNNMLPIKNSYDNRN